MIHSAACFDNINFNGGNLFSDGGSILLSSFIANHNFLDQFSRLSFVDIMKQLMERCYLGYFNQKDQEILRNDPLLRFDSLPFLDSLIVLLAEQTDNLNPLCKNRHDVLSQNI